MSSREQIHPPPWCCWEMVKKCQNFTYWYFDENSKNMIIHRKTSKWKNFGKKCTYGDFDKNFQKFAGCLRVKIKVWIKLGKILLLAYVRRSINGKLIGKLWLHERYPILFSEFQLGENSGRNWYSVKSHGSDYWCGWWSYYLNGICKKRE